MPRRSHQPPAPLVQGQEVFIWKKTIFLPINPPAVRTVWTGTALVPKEVLPRLRQWRGGTGTERRQQLDAGTARCPNGLDRDGACPEGSSAALAPMARRNGNRKAAAIGCGHCPLSVQFGQGRRLSQRKFCRACTNGAAKREQKGGSNWMRALPAVRTVWTGTALIPEEVLPRLRQWRGGTGAERRQQLDAGTARTNDIQINPIVLDNTTVKAYDLFI